MTPHPTVPTVATRVIPVLVSQAAHGLIEMFLAPMITLTS